jgi:2-keto-4-pentenoate hydratase/2-oxohepta-3-ene-1,7-dioic acid hydratase in catechol pathway
VSLNDPAYIEGSGHDRPDAMDFFLKPKGAIIDPGAPIPFPSFAEELGYGGELAAVIDTECHDVAPGEVPEYVLGYTILNDLHAADQPTQNTIVSFDDSAPLGSAIETDVDSRSPDVRTETNG